MLLIMIAACASAGPADRAEVVVLVYNIHAGTDASRVNNLERVAAVTRDSRADIVLLQEVDSGTRRSGQVDQLARLRELTGFYGVFGRTLDYQGGGYGIALLSRWPITFDSLISLDRADFAPPPAHEPRGALVALVASPAGLLRIVNTHLDASKADSFRVWEARNLLAVAGDKAVPGGGGVQGAASTTIIGGDFNSEPESPVHRSVISAGWRDAFSECGRGPGSSFPADRPMKRIDFLFIREGARCTDARVLDTGASDHRPVLIHLSLGRPGKFEAR